MIQNLPKYLGNNLVYEIPVPVAFGCGSDTLTHWSLCRWLLDEAVCVLLPAFTCEPLRHTDPFESLQVAAGRGCVCPPAGLHLRACPAPDEVFHHWADHIHHQSKAPPVQRDALPTFGIFYNMQSKANFSWRFWYLGSCNFFCCLTVCVGFALYSEIVQYSIHSDPACPQSFPLWEMYDSNPRPLPQ